MNTKQRLVAKVKAQLSDADEETEGLYEKASKEELEPTKPKMELLDAAYIQHAVAERDLMRSALAPVSACEHCANPVCCTGTLVPTTPAEAALIIKVHEDRVLKLKDELIEAACRVRGRSLRCPFQSTQGDCLIHDVAPWNCALYYISCLEDEQDCSYVLQKRNTRRAGEEMKYGKIMIAGLDRVLSQAHEDSVTLGLERCRAKYLPEAIVDIMARLHPKTWGSDWAATEMVELAVR